MKKERAYSIFFQQTGQTGTGKPVEGGNPNAKMHPLR
jgi:hypothetical protein